MTRRTALGCVALASCGKKAPDMNALAERYVRLILAIGKHQPKYVDAYYGPAEWQPTASKPLRELSTEVSALITDIQQLTAVDPLRFQYLLTQAQSALAMANILGGEKLDFDREATALYAVKPPVVLRSDLEAARELVDEALPGGGELSERIEKFDARFAVPAAKVDKTFRAAIAEARSLTKKRITSLAANESFDVEYVKDKVWSAYNWYKGNSRSVIQVNIDLPINVDRIIHLACHEGYPGHHVYNGLLEARLVRERGWIEFSVYPLYSPQSLIAEGTADFGASLVMPEQERLAFKRDVLFKEAGLDPKSADEQQAISKLRAGVKHAAIQGARDYLDGHTNAEQTVSYLQRYALNTKGMAERRVKFFDAERSYIINYSYGEDLVAAWVKKTAGNDAAAQWKAFEELLSTPRTPANLL